MKRLPFLLLVVLALQGTACGAPADQSAAATAQDEPATSPAGQEPAAAPGTAQPADAGRGPVMARVNGVPIYKGDYEMALTSFMRSNNLGPDMTPEQQDEVHKVVLDGLIGSELLFQKAKAIPIEVPQEEIDKVVSQTRSRMGEEAFDAEMKNRGMTEADIANQARQNMMVQKLIQDTILAPLTVSEDEITKFYDEHPDEMQRPEGVEASHILIRSKATDTDEQKAQARARIDAAAKRAKAGEDFAALAREYSEDSSASNGGALGVITKGQTVPAFENAAFSLAVGEVSDVVQTQFGYHLIKVTGKKEAGPMPLSEVHDQIGEYLRQTKSRDAIEQMVTSLRSEAKVEIL